MYKLLHLLAGFFMPLIIHAQNDTFLGAASNGTGYCSNAQDGFALYNNSAALTKIKLTAVAFTFDLHPSFSGFNRMAATLSSPIGKQGAWSAGLFRFGDDLFNEQCIAGAYAHRIGITSLGLRATVAQLHAEGFGSKRLATVSASALTDLTPWLTIGAQIINVNQPTIRESERVPATITFNTVAKVSDKVIAMAEAEKNLHYELLLKTGLQYHYNKKIVVRTGFHVKPTAAFFGFGIHLTKIKFDYAFSYLQYGMRHQVSWLYQKRNTK